MALVQCLECGSQISSRATSCPKCGCPEPFKAQQKKCATCNVMIDTVSVSCPECGDPSPFVIEEEDTKKDENVVKLVADDLDDDNDDEDEEDDEEDDDEDDENPLDNVAGIWTQDICEMIRQDISAQEKINPDAVDEDLLQLIVEEWGSGRATWMFLQDKRVFICAEVPNASSPDEVKIIEGKWTVDDYQVKVKTLGGNKIDTIVCTPNGDALSCEKDDLSIKIVLTKESLEEPGFLIPDIPVEFQKFTRIPISLISERLNELEKEYESLTVAMLFTTEASELGAYISYIQGTQSNISHNQRGRNTASDSCFPADAQVWTPFGCSPIAHMAPGDAVLTFNTKSNVIETRSVLSKKEHGRELIWEICIAESEQRIRATRNHRFLSDHGWLRMDEIASGMLISRFNRQSVAPDWIKVSSVLPTNSLEKVYNLHTSFEHNFIVDGSVAHNFSTLYRLQTILYRCIVDPWLAITRRIRGKKMEALIV